MKKEPKKSKKFSEDQEFSIILEKIHSDFKIFGEDLSSVKARLDMLFEELGKQKEEIFIIKTDVRIIKNDIVKINGKLANLEEDVRIIKEGFGKRLTTLETSLK